MVQLTGKITKAELANKGGQTMIHLTVTVKNGCDDGQISFCRTCGECAAEEFYVGRLLYVEIEAVPIPVP